MACDHAAPNWSHHCGDLWRDSVKTAIGRDICDIVGDSPRSNGEWAAMMRRLGVRSMNGVISAVHGCPIDIRKARRGDIVRRGWAIGVIRGELAEFYGGDMVPLLDLDAVWRVSAWPDG